MSNGQKFPSEVEFAAFLVYSPRGQSEEARRSRRTMRTVKLDTGEFVKHMPRMRDLMPDRIRERFLPENATLVPIPGRAPLKDPGSRWAPRQLCEAMVDLGLGARMVTCLERVRPVPKSAFAAPGERPSVAEQFNSLRANRDLSVGSSITLVDDVMTRGRTAVAAVARIQQAYPQATVRVFVVIRTMGLTPDVATVLEPCEGVITWDGVDANRTP